MLNCKLKIKKLPRKVLLVLYNASSHPQLDDLKDSNIRASFLPPNVMSLCQTIDQKVVAAVKK